MHRVTLERAHNEPNRRGEGPRYPVIRSGCCRGSQQRIFDGYLFAFRYASAGLAILVAISKLRSLDARTAAWSHPPKGDFRATPKRWFGPYSTSAHRHLQRAFAAVLFRFTHGYQIDGAVQPTVFTCLDKNHHKCRSNVLANASIYGTVRVCPSLLSRNRDRIGLVVLHEMLHQLGQIRDQRDQVCRKGSENRCYGSGALQLVRHGRNRKALNNNDNLAQFAYFVAKAMSRNRWELST